MNKVVAVTAVSAALCALAPVAHAEWEYARWGQTPAELIAASGGEVKKNRLRQQFPHAADVSSPSALNAPLSADYESDGMTFRAFFSFDEADAGLNEIELALQDRKQCSALRAQLLARHGTPSQIKDHHGMKSYYWLDPAKRNAVKLTYMLDCYIRYTPIKAAKNGR